MNPGPHALARGSDKGPMQRPPGGHRRPSDPSWAAALSLASTPIASAGDPDTLPVRTRSGPANHRLGHSGSRRRYGSSVASASWMQESKSLSSNGLVK